MSNNKKVLTKVGIIGLGMVGEPVRRWFEEVQQYRRGKDLFCYDADPKKAYTEDVNKADIVFVAVPTPSNPDGSCNVSIVEAAVKTINNGKVVVIKSTVQPGTVEKLQKKYPRKKFIFNPEFLTESQALLAMLPRAHFERPWSSDYTKRDINATEAELAKYAANVFGYIKVIYGNILADICHALDVNYENVRETISADSRIGPAWLNVEHGNYCGAGGYCFPKDMNALIAFIESLHMDLSKNKKTDPGLIASLKKGISALEAIVAYNESLIKWQGLSMKDVSYHDKDVIVVKRKKIRGKE